MTKTENQRISKLLKELVKICNQYGTRSRRTKQFIRAYRNLGDFERLAITTIMLKEGGV